MTTMRSAGLLFLVAWPLAAQPRRVEVFGQAGYFQGHDDEGSLGTGPVYSGAVLVPVSRRFAMDFDVSHGRSSRDTGPVHFGTNTTVVSPSLLARFGSERVYGFAGGGAGVQYDQFTSSLSPVDASSTAFILHGRAGIVALITGRLLLRADFVLPFRFIVPNTTVKAGIGYRF